MQLIHLSLQYISFNCADEQTQITCNCFYRIIVSVCTFINYFFLYPCSSKTHTKAARTGDIQWHTHVWIMKMVWKISTSALSGHFFLQSLQSQRYKNEKQSQCFFPSSTPLSSFYCPPFSTFCQFTEPKEGLKVH